MRQLGRTTNQLKRYNLTLPENLYQELQTFADEEHTTVLEIAKHVLKLRSFYISKTEL